MTSRLPRNELRQVKQVKAEAQSELAHDYIALSQACAVTGMSQRKLLDFCAAHSVAHLKYQRQWVIHRQQLFAAFEQHG